MKKLPFCKHRKTVEGCLYCPENDGTRARHTPTPWQWGPSVSKNGRFDIIEQAQTERLICSIPDEQNAAFIIRAVNNIEAVESENARLRNTNDELLAAVKSSHELINDYMNLLPSSAFDAAMFRRHVTGLKAAIAKAEAPAICFQCEQPSKISPCADCVKLNRKNDKEGR